ncbi:GNAT family N-acetyltransferase [Kineosporia sp. J2-2]|uniref:GNAT family N-acetyltransferase n=1 Tax=Kineosporia corallincola TaxID=2835133 RepID=A0ABS5TCR3_9ACTN|nr:GNAT family N-acetyltransferase [Kineosporia corallincola]MBT0768877.1 GNAT family N-acetyltransferase [Kineosporia corallincola]
MSRAPVEARRIEVRRATPGDAAEVLALWARSAAEVARQPGRRPVVPPPDTRGQGGQGVARLAQVIGDGELEVLVARAGGRAAGFLVMRETPLDVLAGTRALCIDEFYVPGAERRHGVGRALLAHVAGQAERLGVEQIVAGVPAWARDTHRYFARLGFAPVTVRRATTAPALRRRLAGADEQRGALENLLSRRRSLRARARRRPGGGDVLDDDAPATA